MSGSPPTRRNGSTSRRFFSRFLTLDIFLAAQIFHPGGFFYPRHQSKFQAMVTLPETNISPEMDGWKTSFLLGMPIFRGYVSFRECDCWFGLVVFRVSLSNNPFHTPIGIQTAGPQTTK